MSSSCDDVIKMNVDYALVCSLWLTNRQNFNVKRYFGRGRIMKNIHRKMLNINENISKNCVKFEWEYSPKKSFDKKSQNSKK